MPAMAQPSEQKQKCRHIQHPPPLQTQTTTAATAAAEATAATKTMAQIFHH